MQGEGDGDCAAGESGGSEGGAERSGKVNLAAAVLLAALAAPDAADQLHWAAEQQRVSAIANWLLVPASAPHRIAGYDNT